MSPHVPGGLAAFLGAFLGAIPRASSSNYRIIADPARSAAPPKAPCLRGWEEGPRTQAQAAREGRGNGKRRRMKRCEGAARCERAEATREGPQMEGGKMEGRRKKDGGQRMTAKEG